MSEKLNDQTLMDFLNSIHSSTPSESPEIKEMLNTYQEFITLSDEEKKKTLHTMEGQSLGYQYATILSVLDNVLEPNYLFPEMIKYKNILLHILDQDKEIPKNRC